MINDQENQSVDVRGTLHSSKEDIHFSICPDNTEKKIDDFLGTKKSLRNLKLGIWQVMYSNNNLIKL